MFDNSRYKIFINKEAVTVKEVVIELLNVYPELKSKIESDIDNFSSFQITFLKNNRIINIDTEVFNGEEIFLLPLAIGG